jgi:capsular exopolysaccharide synthesis family protein
MEFQRDVDQGEYLTKNPRSVVADAFRSLRTNMEFVSVDKPLKTILISSPTVADGKTSVATNLSIVMAQGGKKVILVDADLHRPKVHHMLNLQNRQGLSDLFRDQLSISEVCQEWKVENLKVITSGVLPPNPTDLLGSKKMDTIIDALRREADIVIIDGPPFVVTDASVLATKVDGMLFVVRYGYTRRGSASRAFEQVKRAGVNVVGVAINRLPRRTDDYYYRRYGYYDQDDETGSGSKKPGRRFLPRTGEAAIRNFFLAKKKIQRSTANDDEGIDPHKDDYSHAPGK